MLRTYCPQCDFPQTIADTALGEVVQCRGCLHSYTAELPAPEILPEGNGQQPPTLPARQKKQRSTRTTHTKTFLGLMGSTLMMFGVLVAGVSYIALTGTTKKASSPSQQQQFQQYVPLEYEGPKKIDDLIKEAPKTNKLG